MAKRTLITNLRITPEGVALMMWREFVFPSEREPEVVLSAAFSAAISRAFPGFRARGSCTAGWASVTSPQRSKLCSHGELMKLMASFNKSISFTYIELSDTLSKPTFSYLSGVWKNAAPPFFFSSLLGKNFCKCRIENNYLKKQVFLCLLQEHSSQ